MLFLFSVGLFLWFRMFGRIWMQRRQNLFLFLLFLECIVLFVWLFFLFTAYSVDVFFPIIWTYFLFVLGVCDTCLALQILLCYYKFLRQVGEYEYVRL